MWQSIGPPSASSASPKSSAGISATLLLILLPPLCAWPLTPAPMWEIKKFLTPGYELAKLQTLNSLQSFGREAEKGRLSMSLLSPYVTLSSKINKLKRKRKEEKRKEKRILLSLKNHQNDILSQQENLKLFKIQCICKYSPTNNQNRTFLKECFSSQSSRARLLRQKSNPSPLKKKINGRIYVLNMKTKKLLSTPSNLSNYQDS